MDVVTDDRTISKSTAGEGHYWRQFAVSNFRFLLSGGFRLPSGHQLKSNHKILSEFFGICVASSPDPACDDFNVNCLRELGIEHVRLDYTYSAPTDYTERFLTRLLQDGFHVCLHLVQPCEEARHMRTDAVRREWRAFVRAALERHGEHLTLVELGSTCNRMKWSGYTLDSFVDAWRIAHEEAVAQGVLIAAPNVTDFEPVYNVGFLDIARKEGILPDIHTDNLFAERATEPENYDHKILGWKLASLIKYNVVKKATLLRRITKHYGVEKLMCGHVAWSERRIRRQLADPWQKQADYLQRYLCLMAASGTFDRVYWGPMIGQREGLVDDGTTDYPENHQHVTLYGRALGSCSDYQRRPAFDALKTTVQMLSGTRFVGDHSTSQQLRVLEFTKGDASLHVIWTTNGNGFDPESWYTPDSLNQARATKRDGASAETFPCVIGESPVFVWWDHVQPEWNASVPTVLKCHRFHPTPDATVLRVGDERWVGVVTVPQGCDSDQLSRALHPAALEQTTDKAILRDGRNTVWSFMLPAYGETPLVIKRSQVRSPMRRLLDRHKASRSLRSWNGSSELLRRGIATPKPVAFFESRDPSGKNIGYFVCESFPSQASVRQAFYNFARGAEAYEGVPKAIVYRELAVFIRHMHYRGVFFRDLSSGNILMRVGDDGVPAFSLIDTTRARFFRRGVTLRYQLSDLKRICHRLTWPERHAFLDQYFPERDVKRAMRIQMVFGLYDAKHWYKQKIKRLRRR